MEEYPQYFGVDKLIAMVSGEGCYFDFLAYKTGGWDSKAWMSFKGQQGFLKLSRVECQRNMSYENDTEPLLMLSTVWIGAIYPFWAEKDNVGIQFMC